MEDKNTDTAEVTRTTQKFFADAMLGKLARWMRVLGYDVAYESDIEDAELVDRAVKEDRLILTRDTLIVKRRKARDRSVFIESDSVSDQLRQVVDAYNIPQELFLTRCIRCNSLLEDVDKPSIKDRVPPYVYATQETFSACLSCGRVYWAGTHREMMRLDIERLLKGT